MSHPRDTLLEALAAELGFNLSDPVLPGANYALAVEHDNVLFISGQIPRMNGVVVGTGRVGDDLTLEQGRHAARISTLRCLVILRNSLQTLARVNKVLKLNVYVQCAAGFTQQSEISDAASDILYRVFAPNGEHTRTSVGVFALPKNAAVELDMTVAVFPV